jgi:GntR family galactonate operon transcriptional repressor
MTGMEGGHRPRTPVADGRPPWRPARFASFVLEELAEAIVSGALAEGDVLPTEPALCEQFGFSRTVVREALKMLEERGLARVEQGRGTTVQPRSAWNLLDPVVLRIALAHDHDMSLLDDLIGVRVVLEREMAKAAAGRLTKDELAALAENLEQMNESYDDYERFRSFDLAFHAVVMKASGNEVGLTIVRSIHRHGGITPLLAAGASREVLEQTAHEHREIYDALAAGDGTLAGERIALHIESAWAERKIRERS